MTSSTDQRPRIRGAVRGVVLLVLIAGWLAVAGVGGQKIGELASVQTNDSASYLPASAESVQAAKAAAAFETTGTLPAFVLFTTSDDRPATDGQLAAWQQFADGVGDIVVTLDGGRSATVGDYLPSPQPPVMVPSGDGKAGLVVVSLDEQATAASDDGDPALEPVIEALRTAAADAADGATTHVTGPAGLIADLSEAFAGIDGLLLVVAIAVVLVILLLVYRAVALPLLVLLSSVSSLSLAGWIVYLLADADVVTLNGQSQGILFILVIGAATDYGLLLTARYREELHANSHPVAAVLRAWRACVAPISASAATVIIGLLCLLLSDLNSNTSLGPVGAIGIGSALLGALTLLPALLATGRWVFWPRIPRFDRAQAPGPAVAPDAGRRGFWPRLAAAVDRHPRRIWSGTAVVLLAMCAALPTFSASGTEQADVFLSTPDSVHGQRAMEQHFPGGAGNPVQIVVPVDQADRVAAAVDAAPGVAGEAAPRTESGRPGGEPLVADDRMLLEATLADGVDTEEAKDTIRQIRAAVDDAGLGGQVLVGGQTAQLLDTQIASDHDLRVIIPAILLAVLLVLMVLLRALVAPLVLIAATVLSFGSALGVSALVFNHVLDFPGADPAVPLYAFVFLVALGVDYSIFLMSRAREEAQRHGPRQGVLSALVSTGGVITSAGVVLAATFAALGVIPILFLAQVAFIVGFGVLLDTLVVRSLLVSAAAVDLDRFIWWPSRLSRRLAGSDGGNAADQE